MAGLRMCATIAKSLALRGIIGKIARPLNATILDDETLERRLNLLPHTLYHPVGTCRMGGDEASAVDPAAAGARRRRAAGSRCVGDADDHPRAHPSAQRPDRREGRGPHPLLEARGVGL